MSTPKKKAFKVGDIVRLKEVTPQWERLYLKDPNQLGLIVDTMGNQASIHWSTMNPNSGCAAWFEFDILEMVQEFKWPKV